MYDGAVIKVAFRTENYCGVSAVLLRHSLVECESDP